MFGVHGTADVDGGEDGEDEGLQDGHQNLETGEADKEQERERPDDNQRAQLEDRGGDHGEADEQEVAGQHVGEEPH